MTFAERTAAVEAFGFTPRQAAFLTTVALHGGYCLLRQYAAFIGRKHGESVCDFMDRLVDRGLADRLTFRANRGNIYHLFGKRLYGAIDQENNRNRLHASPPLMARKLMLLDFVIEHAGFEWYATDDDKKDLFLTQCRMPEAALPQRTQARRRSSSHAPDTSRHWIQKLPIFRAATPPSINFVCLVTDPHASAVGSFVREHAPLLRKLESWALHVISPRAASSETAAGAAYQRALAAARLTPVDTETWEWFQQTRERVLRGDLREVGLDDLNRYRELSAQIGDGSDRPCVGPLLFHVLPHSYTQFGSLAGVA